MNEEVMVVPAVKLAPHLTGRPRHLVTDGTEDILALIRNEHLFIARAVAEVSPEYRQIIPYVVLRHDDTYFLLERTSKQNESRLHNRLSLGIGGHINPGYDLMGGLKKELEEEVRIDDGFSLQPLGILNDESTEVGRVHLGVVFVANAAGRNARVLETEKMRGEWTSASSLVALRDRMESWSQIVFDHLEGTG